MAGDIGIQHLAVQPRVRLYAGPGSGDRSGRSCTDGGEGSMAGAGFGRADNWQQGMNEECMTDYARLTQLNEQLNDRYVKESGAEQHQCHSRASPEAAYGPAAASDQFRRHEAKYRVITSTGTPGGAGRG